MLDGRQRHRGHGARHIVRRFQAGEIIQVLLDGLQAIGLDGGGVLEGVIEIAQLLLFVAELVVGLLLQLIDDGRACAVSLRICRSWNEPVWERSGGITAVFSHLPLT